MKTTLKLITAICLAGTLGISGCQKDPGPRGEKGSKGDPGTANVISSTTATITNWILNTDDGTNWDYDANLTWSPITASVIDKGIVMVYLQAGTGWIALPYSFSDQSSSLSMNVAIYVNQVTIGYSGYDAINGSPGNAAFLNAAAFAVRIVVIPPAMIKKDVDYKDYNSVKAGHNIQD